MNSQMGQSGKMKKITAENEGEFLGFFKFSSEHFLFFIDCKKLKTYIMSLNWGPSARITV